MEGHDAADGRPAGSDFLTGPEGGHNGFLAARGLTFDWAHADLTIEGKRFADIGVRYKGNGTFSNSSGQGKISMKLHLNKYVKGQKLAGLSMLISQTTSPTRMDERRMAYKLFRDAGVPAPRVSYARVYITVTGKCHDATGGSFR